MPTERFSAKLRRYVKEHGKLPHPDRHHRVEFIGAAVIASTNGMACFVCGTPIPHKTGVLDWQLGVAMHKPCFTEAQTVIEVYTRYHPRFSREGREWIRTYLLKERLLAYLRDEDESLYGSTSPRSHGQLYRPTIRRRA